MIKEIGSPIKKHLSREKTTLLEKAKLKIQDFPVMHWRDLDI
jgi:hypothetical protein